MVVYPLIGMALGHGYPNSPAFGVAPCPTTIFTFGVLLLVPIHWLTLIIPTLWALVGSMAAIQLGVREDLGLPIVAIATVIAIRGRRVKSAEPHASGPVAV